jgi:hypothetical protein
VSEIIVSDLDLVLVCLKVILEKLPLGVKVFGGVHFQRVFYLPGPKLGDAANNVHCVANIGLRLLQYQVDKHYK